MKIDVRKFSHGGARFFVVDDDGCEHLFADTYTKEATRLVSAAALSGSVSGETEPAPVVQYVKPGDRLT